MNFLDIIILIPLLWMGYRGFSKGLIISVATLVALIAGIYLSINFSYYAAEHIKNFFSMNETQIRVTAFVVTFLSVVVVVMLIARFLEKIFKVISLGFIDKLCGAVFGLLKAGVLLSTVFLLINIFDSEEKVISAGSKSNSYFYSSIVEIVPSILPMIDIDQWKKSIDDINIMNQENDNDVPTITT